MRSTLSTSFRIFFASATFRASGFSQAIPLSEPRPLFRDSYVRSTRRELNYAVSPDGTRFLMVEAPPPPDRPVHLIMGWPDELEPRLAKAAAY